MTPQHIMNAKSFQTPPKSITGAQPLSSGSRAVRGAIVAIAMLTAAVASVGSAATPTGWGRMLGSKPVTVYSNGYSGYWSGVRIPVKVYINGSQVTFKGGIGYQCVELVQRMCILLHRSDPQASEFGGGADAVNWWLKTSYFYRYTNGGTTKPVVGDLVIWSNGTGPGHIATVTAVNTTSVTIAEQNILCNLVTASGRSDANHVVTMTKGTNSSGRTTYKLDNNAPNSRGGYTTVGWIRKR